MDDAFPDALPFGHRLHWYVIEHVLGQGGFGITHLALDTNLDRYVAIKEFLPAGLARRSADFTVQARTEAVAGQYAAGLARFLAEGRTLARFDHSSIVRVFSVFEANGTAYMVMRFEEGEDLATRLERCGTLDERELLGWLLPILDGLRLVHEAGYIHRDIKPENIYLRHDGSPVLLDFGSARQSLGEQQMMTILVAPGYAPLEQYHGDPTSQGPWTDIYGLGATCYRAITGQAPNDAVARAKGVLGSTRDILKPASELAAGRYSARLLAAVDMSLQLNERDRPQSIAEWWRALVPSDAVQAATPVPAPVPQPAVTAPPAPAQLPSTPHAPGLLAANTPPLAAQAGDRHPPVATPARRAPPAWGLVAGAATLAAVAAVWALVRSHGDPTPPLAVVTPAPPSLPAQASAADGAPIASELLSPRPMPPPVPQPALPPAGVALDPRLPTPATTVARPSQHTTVATQPPAAAAVPTPSRAVATAPEGPPATALSALTTPVVAPPLPTTPAQGASAPAATPAAVGVDRVRADEQIAAAETALNRGDFAAAADVLTPMAQAGVPRAQVLLARAQEGRSDRQRSDFEAYLWYGIAVRTGDGGALVQRDRVAARLQPAEIRQANHIIERWKPSPSAANDAAR